MLLTPLRTVRQPLCSLSLSRRAFSSTPTTAQKLRIGYIPEHFLTPLHFASEKYGLSEHAELISYPSGTGTLIDAFHAKDIDVAFGLTEAWIVGLTKTFGGSDWSDKPYHLVGAYTLSPLTWGISTGARRDDLQYVEELQRTKVGVSRLGSGSHVMASVLAATHGWKNGGVVGGTKENEVVECGPFKALREAVTSGKADWFMWEHFTTKKYWDEGVLKRLGELETPWPAWHVAARGAYAHPSLTTHLFPALSRGIKHFQSHPSEAIDYISSTMEYSRADAEEWYKTVRFANRKQMGELDSVVVTNAIGILEKAGALGDRRILRESDVAAVDAERYMASASWEYEQESAAPFRG